jgi:hypothetical protein
MDARTALFLPARQIIPPSAARRVPRADDPAKRDSGGDVDMSPQAVEMMASHFDPFLDREPGAVCKSLVIKQMPSGSRSSLSGHEAC